MNRVDIVYMANYTRGKGQQYAIEMLRMIIQEFHGLKVKIHFYGSCFNLYKNLVYKNELWKLAKEYGLEPNVIFYDKCVDQEKCLKNYDISLNLSDSESFSRLTLESLYYGIPIIATDVGGTREMFSKDCYGQFMSKRERK